MVGADLPDGRTGEDTWDLPDGWTVVPLGSLVDVLDHKRVPVNADERSKRLGDIPYYGATGQVGWIDDYLFEEELLLLGEDGAPFLDKSKPIAFLIGGKSWVNNHAHVLRAIDGMTTNRFLLHYLNSFDFDGYVTGSTRLKLTQRSMREIPVLLPPLPEQRRIVAKVEALLARVNAARDRLARVPALLKRFRQSVLAAACSGRLTEGSRAKSPQGWDSLDLSSEPRPRQGIDEPDPLALPEIPTSWRWERILEVADPKRPITYGVIKLGAAVPGGVPTLRSSDVRWLRIDTDAIKPIAPGISNAYSRTILHGGEVLVTVRGTLGGVAVAPQGVAGANVSREVAVVAPKSGVEARYLAQAIASPWAQGWLSEVAKGVAYTGVNIRDLKRLPVPLPSLAEQREIVDRVESLFALADTIEQRAVTALHRADRLTQSILSLAFRGELVPTEADLAGRDGREYETAGALLARIRREAARHGATDKVQTRTPTRRKAPMTKIDKASVLDVIRTMPGTVFTFEDLRSRLPGDYDALREVIFALLDDSESGLTQAFDRETRALRFRWRAKS